METNYLAAYPFSDFSYSYFYDDFEPRRTFF